MIFLILDTSGDFFLKSHGSGDWAVGRINSRLRVSGLRDVSVAGSNPVTPTIDFLGFINAYPHWV
jgi:hypothetical protein